VASPPAQPRLIVATCQFPVGHDIRMNAKAICRLIGRAADAGAGVAHFPECALSGYGSSDWPSWDGFDWDSLDRALQQVRDCCAAHAMWAVLGSNRRDRAAGTFHNAQLIIADDGSLAGHYDKRRCSANDQRAFTPGCRPLMFDISGVRCGGLICLDWSYPELFAAYADAGADLIFLSAYSAGGSRCKKHLHSDVVVPLMQGHAFANSVYISVSNCSLARQSFPSVWVKRSGRIGKRCRLNTTGLAINAVSGDSETQAFYKRVRNFRAESRSRDQDSV